MDNLKKLKTVDEMLCKLDSIHDDMLILTLEGELGSEDFRNFKALAAQLHELHSRLSPKYALPNLPELIASWQKEGVTA